MIRIIRAIVVFGAFALSGLPAAVAVDANNAARDAALQAAAAQFVVVVPEVDDDGRAQAVTLALNAAPVVHDGVRFDGFRFTAPTDGAKLLVWGFLKQPNLSGWYIVPVSGSVRGFSRFFHQADSQGRTVIVQTLPTANLRAGEDYLIWFSFKDAEPTNLTVWLRFASPATTPSSFSAVRALLNPAPVE